MRTLVLVFLTVVAACGIVPAGAPTLSIHAERDPGADLSSYRSWGWAVDRSQGRAWNPDDPRARLDSIIRAGIASELAARGIQPAGPSGPELLFNYDIAVKEKSTDTFTGYFDYRLRGGSGDMGDAFMGYDEGSLIIVATDAHTGRMVWRGSATAVLSEDHVKDAIVSEAVHRIFERFS